MPRRTASKANRCEYNEKGRRCVRNGTGSPCVCRAHRLVLEEEARKMNEREGPPPGAVAADFVARFATGKNVSAQDFFAAMADAFEAVANGIPVEPPRWNRPQPQSRPPRPRAAPRPPPPPPPPPSPKRDLAGARVAMGFPPTGALTLEMVKKRRRELGRKHHPDLVPPAQQKSATERMKVINAAADLLEQSLS